MSLLLKLLYRAHLIPQTKEDFIKKMDKDLAFEAFPERL